MKNAKSILTTVGLLAAATAAEIHACTGITLRAMDGAVVCGRTMEWGSFDLNSRIIILPRGHEFIGHTPAGKNGLRVRAKHGVVAIDGLQKVFCDGMNEKGLVVGAFYHPGCASYREYDASKAEKSMSSTDVLAYLLATCATVEEVREALADILVVSVVEESIGKPAPFQLMVTEPSGKQIVVQWLEGETKISDAPLGVITNAPTYDWHLTNLRNYVNLSPVALPSRKIEELEFSPLGGGSGMIGLPGDFTPPSRFIRAVAFSKTARKTPNAPETVYELFRILDNFNVPLGAAESGGETKLNGMRSSTIWTCGYDLSNRILYWHTQNNRQVQKVEVSRIDFENLAELQAFPLDPRKEQAVIDRTPSK
jgi:choloylglycine hydrolase